MVGYSKVTCSTPTIGNDHLQGLDLLLGAEEQMTGKRVFKRGGDLRHGLIDVKGVLQTINVGKG